MSTYPHSQDGRVDDAIAERATQWFLANRGGPLASADRAAFAAWLVASPLHIREYLAVVRLHRELPAALADSPAEWTAACGADSNCESGTNNVIDLVVERAPEGAAPRASSKRIRLAAVACAAALLLMTGGAFLIRGLLGSGNTVQTAHGEQRILVLKDGSVVHLNSDTRIRVRLGERERRIQLDRGQALFDVAHDTARPFRVSAGNTEVTAVGTTFDVRRLVAGTQVTVVEGRVDVTREIDARSGSADASTASRRLRLDAGERVEVRVADSSGAALRPATVDARQATAWTRRQIVVQDRPLEEVVQEFNRYTGTPIEIEGDALAKVRVGGVFDAYDTESFLLFVERATGARIRHESNRIVMAAAPAATDSP